MINILTQSLLQKAKYLRTVVIFVELKNTTKTAKLKLNFFNTKVFYSLIQMRMVRERIQRVSKAFNEPKQIKIVHLSI